MTLDLGCNSIDDLPLVELDATAQAELVRAGRVTPEELLDAAITRIKRLNPALNALSASAFEAARERARTNAGDGAFAGVPTLLKDLIAYPGQPLGLGSRLMSGQIAPAGSPYTEALDAAGLVVLGKTTTSEFGLVGTTEPLVTGKTRNPWDLSRSTGGSSGGAAAAVASGMVPVAHASDGGGSIRGPASLCGVFGFKPTRWRTRSAGLPKDMPIAAILSEHCVSRSVRDSATWLRVTETEDWAEPLPEAADLFANPPRKLRIGFYGLDAFGNLPDEAARAALEQTITLCHSLDHTLVPVEGPLFDGRVAAHAVYDIMAMTTSAMVDYLAPGLAPDAAIACLEPYTLTLIEHARALPPSRFVEAAAEIAAAGDMAQAALDDVEVLLSPTIPFTAFPLGTISPDCPLQVIRRHFERSAAYTAAASLAGWPAMSVPLFWTEEGLPVGSHFAARAGEDALLFQLAFQLENAAPWLPRLSALSRTLACRKS
ncbi:amidase [Rhizobium sp. BK181]|uniref:amidase n=1 Tax=Rhizobium sp. BK181 TaxID=2587072 RepID=UPI00161BE2A4|nr:amidase family protein [Rhizobium sp. BK181]MBB3319585.1 amidase [Rhizobium sp. BK181]